MEGEVEEDVVILVLAVAVVVVALEVEVDSGSAADQANVVVYSLLRFHNLTAVFRFLHRDWISCRAELGLSILALGVAWWVC